MIGCGLAALGLVLGAMAFRHHRRLHHRMVWAGGCGPAGFRRGRHRHGGDPWRGDDDPGAHGPDLGFGGRRAMWWLLGDLDLSPAQDKVVRQELAQLRERAAALRDEGRATRADLARAVRGEALDEVALGEMYARQDAELAALRDAVAGALGRIHLALDPEQRERLADRIAGGGRGGRRWGGPYR